MRRQCCKAVGRGGRPSRPALFNQGLSAPQRERTAAHAHSVSVTQTGGAGFSAQKAERGGFTLEGVSSSGCPGLRQMAPGEEVPQANRFTGLPCACVGKVRRKPHDNHAMTRRDIVQPRRKPGPRRGRRRQEGLEAGGGHGSQTTECGKKRQRKLPRRRSDCTIALEFAPHPHCPDPLP